MLQHILCSSIRIKVLHKLSRLKAVTGVLGNRRRKRKEGGKVSRREARKEESSIIYASIMSKETVAVITLPCPVFG